MYGFTPRYGHVVVYGQRREPSKAQGRFVNIFTSDSLDKACYRLVEKQDGVRLGRWNGTSYVYSSVAHYEVDGDTLYVVYDNGSRRTINFTEARAKEIKRAF